MIAAHQASHAGLAHLGSRLKDAAILAFLHSFAGGCLVAGGVAAAGALVAIFLLPARPRETRVTGTDSQLASAPDGDDVQAASLRGAGARRHPR